MPRRIEFAQEMVDICSSKPGGQADFFIALASGAAKSSKSITFSRREGEYRWTIFNDIDGSSQFYCTTRNMLKFTHIGEAIEKGAFYAY